jgi:peptidoglycan/xylan/chitin deacetylase (PgdA/CDA1 family)
MRQAINMSSSKTNPSGFLPVIFSFFLIILTAGYLSYQFIPEKNGSFFYFSGSKRTIYFLVSRENEIYLNKIGASVNEYEDNINRLIKKFSSGKIKCKTIEEQDINSLKKGDILFIFDDYYVSKRTIKDIEGFLKRGGNLLFNYHFGYMDENGFVKAGNIEKITKLKYLGETVSCSSCNFYVSKILSPLNMGENSFRHDLVLYADDTVPIFGSKQTPDAVLTNWEITSTPILNKKMLPLKDSGVIWHGFYKGGKWFYFSFPGYVFLDMKKNTFNKFFGNIFNYMTNTYSAAKYPFIDAKNAVFISEDTEYKYTNMIHFARLAAKYGIPVTLFCVAELAQKHPFITKEAAELPNVEIGSHSYSHTRIEGAPIKKVIKEILGSKEILEKITGRPVFGFRPPREEIDKAMENELRAAGYKYVMEKTKPYLLPEEEYDRLITIPRHGTDDYIYLINLNWDKEKILKKIIQETDMLTSLNAVYTLSVHTHLLSYKSNLGVSEKYFKYLIKHKNIHPFKGIDITDRIKLNKKIALTLQPMNDKTFLYIHNRNDTEVKNFCLRIYWPNSENIKIIPELSSVKITVLKQNTQRKYTDIKIDLLRPESTISLILENNE